MSSSALPIDFWFDFISPYGYLASLRIDALAARHGRTVRWHPLLLGVTVVKVMGLKPLMQTPLKRDYVPREIARYTRRHGVVLARALDAPPMNPLPAARAFAWLLQQAPAADAKRFAQAALHAVWAEGLDLGDAAAVQACGHRAGLDAGTMDRATQDPQAATLLRAEVDAAVARGVFGVDKFELLEDWLATGGW